MNYSTYHATTRAKERRNLSAGKADREFELVLRYGKRAESFSNAQQKQYLARKENAVGTRAFVYEDYCYIFSAGSDLCITCYELPKWFNRGLAYAGKERIRKVKNYARLNPDADYELDDMVA